MTDLGDQKAYWDGVGATKTFTHPLDLGLLAGLGPDARILDYGCGYGRLMAELSEHGFRDVSGVDLSTALIERGRLASPELRFDVLESPPVVAGASAGSFDAVLLFAVLTCVPEEAAQQALVAELHRVLAPGGLLYVSDLLLQEDERNRLRYAAYAEMFGTQFGVFATDDGAVCRHHDLAYLHRMVGTFFEVLEERRIETATMNGNHSKGIQLLLRKR